MDRRLLIVALVGFALLAVLGDVVVSGSLHDSGLRGLLEGSASFAASLGAFAIIPSATTNAGTAGIFVVESALNGSSPLTTSPAGADTLSADLVANTSNKVGGAPAGSLHVADGSVVLPAEDREGQAAQRPTGNFDPSAPAGWASGPQSAPKADHAWIQDRAQRAKQAIAGETTKKVWSFAGAFRGASDCQYGTPSAKAAVASASGATSLAGVGYLTIFYGLLCCWGGDSGKLPHGKNIDLARREALIDLVAQAVGEEPAAPLMQLERKSPVEPDCKNPQWHPVLFTGSRRTQAPSPVIDVISGVGGGAELDLLEIRFYELRGLVDLFVVSESAFNFRGDRKPRLFADNKDRFKAFLPSVLYLDLDQCSFYRAAVEEFRRLPASRRPQNVFGLQTAHRSCIWTQLTVKRPELPDDTQVIFTDLDEIPHGAAIQSLKHCEWAPTHRVESPTIVQFHFFPVSHNLRSLRNKCPADDWVQGVLVTMKRVRQRVRDQKTMAKENTIYLRYGSVRHMGRAGVHLQATSNLAQITYKGLQHGEGGGIPTPVTGSGARGFCLATTPEGVEAAQKVLQDDPSYFLKPVGKAPRSSNSRLPDKPPPPEVLERCRLPWVLIANPQRYPFFYGTGHWVSAV